MTPQTFNNIMNENSLDTSIGFTLADAIGYIEFEEDINSWEEEVEDICEFLLDFEDGDYVINGVDMKHIEQDSGVKGSTYESAMAGLQAAFRRKRGD